MNTPTPETDALDTGLADYEWDEGYGVLLEHARNLECERDAAIKARNHNRVCVERLVDERDEYKKLLSETLKSDMPVVERLLLERDQLRKVCDELLDETHNMINYCEGDISYTVTDIRFLKARCLENLKRINSLPHVIAAKKGNEE